MGIMGLRSSNDFATDERPKNWREVIYRLDIKGSAPLTALTNAMKERSVDDPEFYWWDKKIRSRRIKLAAPIATTSATTFTVVAENQDESDGAGSVKEGDLLLIEGTEEIARVAANPTSDTQLVVTRGFAGSTPATLSVGSAGINPYMFVMGSAYEEASNSPRGVNFNPVKRYNYTQIFRNSMEMSRTAKNTRLRTGDQVKEARREILELHSMDMERAFFFGRRSEVTVNGNPLRTFDGVNSIIPAENVIDAATAYPGGMDWGDFEEICRILFRWGSNEKVAFLGNRALLAINKMVRGAKNVQWQISGKVEEFGMAVQRLTTPFGELVLKTHPLLNYLWGGTTASATYYGYEARMYVLDMANFTYVYLKGSDTKYNGDIQANGIDGMKSEFLTECSIEIHHPQSHGLIKNLAFAAAES